MSAREVNVRIGRLVVDALLRSEAAQWGNAIQRALQAQLTDAPAVEAHVPEAIAQQIARRVQPLPAETAMHVPSRQEVAQPQPAAALVGRRPAVQRDGAVDALEARAGWLPKEKAI